MTNKPLILIIEDEKPIQKFMQVSLEAQGYVCKTAADGQNGIALTFSYNPEIIILDLGLPDMDGMDVIHKVRPMTRATIIVVSARGQEREKVFALDAGADDYLTKPFSVAELSARIRVALRRVETKQNADTPVPTFQTGGLVIDYEKRIISVNDEEIHLTPMEYKLLVLLSQHPGKVLTHRFILNEIWGTYSGDDTQSLRVLMASIRRKLEANQPKVHYIQTEVGVGYRLVEV